MSVDTQAVESLEDVERPSGLHHVGIPVRDIERSVEWYRRVLGLATQFVQDADEGPGLDSAVGLKSAKLRYAFLPVGSTNLELLEYQNPVGDDFKLRNCDVGAVHVAFKVDDIHAVHERLVAAGADVAGPPNQIENGPLAGQWFCYFRDPDGVQLEIFQTS